MCHSGTSSASVRTGIYPDSNDLIYAYPLVPAAPIQFSIQMYCCRAAVNIHKQCLQNLGRLGSFQASSIESCDLIGRDLFVSLFCFALLGVQPLTFEEEACAKVPRFGGVPYLNFRFHRLASLPRQLIQSTLNTLIYLLSNF